MAIDANYWNRSRISRRTALAGAGMGLSAVALAACGGSNNNSSSKSTNGASNTAANTGAKPAGTTAGLLPPAATGTPAAASKQPKPGGSFSFQISSPPPSLDPYTQTSYINSYLNSLTYSRLLRFRNGVTQYAPTDFTSEPDLAQTLPEIPNPLQLTYKLKPAKWHNVAPVNGRDLTSEDIRYAIDRYAHYEKSVHQGFWSWLDSIETPDKSTVILKAKYPYADAVQVSGGGAGDALGGYISPKEWAETDGAATKMVGSGPFINTEYQTGTSLSFKKNPDYYDKPFPYFDDVKVLITTDTAKRVADFAAKSVDLTWLFLPDERDQLKKSRPDAKSEETQGIGGYVYMRTDKPPFNDKRVRQALSMSIDRKAIREAISKGEGVPDQLYFVGFDFARQVKDLGPAAKYWDYNPTEAKKLLDAAGASNLSMTWSHADAAIYTQAYVDTSSLTQAQWKQIGITVQDISQPYAQYISTTYQGNYEGIGHSPRAVPSFLDYVSERFTMKPKRGRINLSYVNDPALEDLMDKQRAEFNLDARKKIIKDIEDLVAEQQYEIYYSTDTRTFFWNNNIEVYRPSAFFPYTHIMKAWRDA